MRTYIPASPPPPEKKIEPGGVRVYVITVHTLGFLMSRSNVYPQIEFASSGLPKYIFRRMACLRSLLAQLGS